MVAQRRAVIVVRIALVEMALGDREGEPRAAGFADLV